MWKTVLKRAWFSNVKKTFDRVDRLHRLNLSRQLCNHVSTKHEYDKPKQSEKEWFLYLQMDNGLYRLNIKEFCEKTSSNVEMIYGCRKLRGYPEEIEFLHNSSFLGYRSGTAIPFGMRSVIVDSKVYMIGGYKDPSDSVRNLDVYSFDPTDPARAPSFRLCEGPISRLIPPFIFVPPYEACRVFSIEGKIYVLAPVPAHCQPLQDVVTFFRVFDPVQQSFKDLPQPPYSPNAKPYVHDHFVCGHKLFIRTTNVYNGYRESLGLYIFDTREEKWKAVYHDNIIDSGNHHYEECVAFTEFEGFLILVRSGHLISDSNTLVSYKLDSDGIPDPESYQELHELHFTDSDELNFDNIFLGKCDGGRMWVVQMSMNWFKKKRNEIIRTYVRVFQVSISTDVDGNQSLSVQIEAEEFLNVKGYDYCTSAFAICHHPNRIESCLPSFKQDRVTLNTDI